MCGFAGLLNSRIERKELNKLLVDMGEQLRHRGPDASGVLVDDTHDLGFVHSRLSILDLDPRSDQPFRTSKGNSICFNGEIYNFRAIREELEQAAYVFSTQGDTEILAGAIETWGIEPALNKLSGMFAFAFFDQSAQRLYLARDRLGEKPLYLGCDGQRYFFASEVRAFCVLPWFTEEINLEGLRDFYNYNYVSEFSCIYENAQKLQPGSLVEFTFDKDGWRAELPRRWWMPKIFVPSVGRNAVNTSSAQSEYVDSLDTLLTEVIKNTLIADVNVGMFLSGGIDSSLVCTIAQQVSNVPLRTFSVGFQEEEFDEASQARQVAEIIGTNHEEFLLTPDDLITVVEELPLVYDEPFADSSQIPTVFLSKKARECVKVVLTGDGGDELFGGYNRYVWLPKIRKINDRFGQGVAKIVSNLIQSASLDMLRRAELIIKKQSSRPPRVAQFIDKRDKIISCLRASSLRDGYEQLLRVANSDALGRVGRDLSETQLTAKVWEGENSTVSKMILSDLLHYLPGDILTKVDRATMSQSLEARAPLLDQRITHFALNMPEELKIYRGQSKYILRQLLKRYLPTYPDQSAKRGFAVPLATWLRGPLRDWGETKLFSGECIPGVGYDKDRIGAIWATHQAGDKNYSEVIWGQIMLACWATAHPNTCWQSVLSRD